MTSREIVYRAVRFEGVNRLPRGLPEPYGTDFAQVGPRPSPDERPPNGLAGLKPCTTSAKPAEAGWVK